MTNQKHFNKHIHNPAEWTIEHSAELYNINNWGSNFFRINEKGNVGVHPRHNGVEIDLKRLVDDLEVKGIGLPLLVRFSDILEMRLRTINECFAKAAQEYNYQGRYFGVYPIKVNQQRQVVEEVVNFGRAYNFGLEAGSKPELHAVLAMMDNPEALIVCNGYKDEAYIRLALIGQKLDRRIFIVVEKLNELDLIIKVAKKLNIRPLIGLRIKLNTAGAGKWESSGGEFSKFGLNSPEIMSAISRCAQEQMLDCIQLLHFHLGSQIPNIRHVKDGLKEICCFFAELVDSGCNINYIDVGGGLAVDYDGTRSSAQSSMNYSIQEYANDIVYALSTICNEKKLRQPHIVSESGRALTAHHSVMVFNVLEATTQPNWGSEDLIEDSDDAVIKELYDIYKQTVLENNKDFYEAWHDAMALKDQALTKFNLGLFSLKGRAKAERLFWSIATYIYKRFQEADFTPLEFATLKEKLADKYFCNFSMFQSIPDSWAIDQIFPIMPIHRLQEYPTKEATLQDITCDSDGKVDLFLEHRTISPVLHVHEFNQDDYVLGIFLVGAYQEILGDLHNLFGDTNTVHVVLDDKGGWNYEQIIEGENVSDVLDYVQFKSDDLLERMSRLVGISLGKGSIQNNEAEELMTLFRQGLQGYTYLIRTTE